jgi:hypothetical protein
MSKKCIPKTFPSRLESQKYYSRPQSNDQDHKIKTKNKNKNLQATVEEHDIVGIPSENPFWLKKTIRSKVEESRSGLQTRSKATRQKRRPVKPTEKTSHCYHERGGGKI